MSILFWILLGCLISGVLSLAGGAILLIKAEWVRKFSTHLVSLAVAAHELPQEIGDFSVMLHHGWSRAKVLIANIVSSLSNIAGAFLAFFASNYLEPRLPYLLALTSGIFIYIAAADLIPEISMYHRRNKTSHVFVLIVLGIFAVGVLRYYLEGSH